MAVRECELDHFPSFRRLLQITEENNQRRFNEIGVSIEKITEGVTKLTIEVTELRGEIRRICDVVKRLEDRSRENQARIQHLENKASGNSTWILLLRTLVTAFLGGAMASVWWFLRS